MRPRFYRLPDNTDAKATTPSLLTTPSGIPINRITHKQLIPTKQADLAKVGIEVGNSWPSHPELTLMWITPADFAKDAKIYSTQISQTLKAGSNKSPNKSTLDMLDIDINAGLKKIKKRLNVIYDEPAVFAQYSRYGLSKKGKNYMFPTDRDSRLLNLDLIIDSIVVDGIDKNNDYGTAFWTKMKDDYSAALSAASGNNQKVSGLVGTKTVSKEHISEVLSALWHIIQGNHRDNAYAVALSMGFRKTGQ